MDGRSGLAAVATHHPDAILLDIRLPDIDGFEVCRQLKSNLQLAQIPVIFLSANVKDEAKQTAYKVGGSTFLSKPYDAKDVLAAIEDATGAKVICNQRPEANTGGK